MSADPFELRRFILAQDPVMESVRSELRAGRKTSHWMWFVFPQVAGLGSSARSVRYAISSREEARAYLDHPVLGPRLIECVGLVLAVEGRSAHEIFGSPDDEKFHSCLTLFSQVSTAATFVRAMVRYFDGKPDETTLKLLGE